LHPSLLFAATRYPEVANGNQVEDEYEDDARASADGPNDKQMQRLG
jgi:hypothetical protein